MTEERFVTLSQAERNEFLAELANDVLCCKSVDFWDCIDRETKYLRINREIEDGEYEG